MVQFFTSLNDAQLALLLAPLVPVLHYFLRKLHDFTTAHNWLLSFVLPVIVVVVDFLVKDPNFNQAFPLLGSVYLVSQAVYFAVIRKYHENRVLKAQIDQILSNGKSEVIL